MLMLFSMTLTLMQGHSGSTKAKNQHCMLSETKQAVSIKLAATVGHFLSDLSLQTFIWLVQLVLNDKSLSKQGRDCPKVETAPR